VPSVLTSRQVAEFIDTGYVRLEGAFAPEVVASVRSELESRTQVGFDDPTTWPCPRITLADVMVTAPFTDAVSDRVAGALDDLIGPSRWEPVDYMGWWQITFPGFAEIDYGDDWHVDGRDFTHLPWSPELRMFPLFLFSDVPPGGGGTLIDVGSHHRVASELWRHVPDGLTDLEVAALITQHPKTWSHVEEATGQAGDVVLCHPMIFHSSNRNDGVAPRIQATPHVVAAGPVPTTSPSAVDEVIWNARL